jgi:LPS sulfotransferase NodH
MPEEPQQRRAVREYAHWIQQPELPRHSVRPKFSYFICGTPRSGSWLLCGLMASSGVAGRPHEWFLPEVEQRCRQEWQLEGTADYLDCIRRAATTPNGVFAAKMMWGYFDRVLDLLGRDVPQIARSVPNPRFVWITRQDTTAQAVSWASALQTGRWQHWAKPRQAPVYDGAQIAGLIGEILAGEEGWRDWFARHAIEPVRVTYEELAADPARVARGVVESLGIEAGDTAFVTQTVMLGDDLNREWALRYRADRG